MAPCTSLEEVRKPYVCVWGLTYSNVVFPGPLQICVALVGDSTTRPDWSEEAPPF